MSYYFEKDAEKKGKNFLIASVVTLIITINFHIFFFFIASVSEHAPLFIWGFATLFILIFVVQGIKFIKCGGKWEISINEQGISWKTPNESLDTSFDLQLNEIERLVTETSSRRTGSSGHTFTDHLIHTKSGLVFKVNEISGIKGTRVISELAKETGISCEYTTR